MSVISCVECASVWPTRLALEKHKRHEHKVHKCKYCNKGFATITRVDAHIEKIHPNGDEPNYLCDVCGSKFRWNSTARRCKEKCNTYGGSINKAEYFFTEACKRSLVIDGSLIHASSELQKLNKQLSKIKRDYLTRLYHTSRESAKQRLKKGRKEAGVHNITLNDLFQLYISQAGECYYTGMSMILESHSDWRGSVERLDPELGYTKENTVLICAEFNSSVQWDLSKIEQFKELLKMKHERTISEMKPRKDMKGVKHCKVIKTETHCICNKCGKEKLLENFNVHLKEGCKDCQVNCLGLRRSTPQGHFSKLLTTMRQSSKVRGHEPPSLTQKDLVDVLNEQGGLCAYTGLKMNFGSIKEKSWVCSVDRRDVSKGYTAANISLICYEFNTMDMRNMPGRIGRGNGSSSWNHEKLQQLTMFWKNKK